MGFFTGSSKNWHPAMTGNTTIPSYWLNWRVLFCATWLLLSTVLAAFLITKYESLWKWRNREREGSETLYEDEAWMPCLRGVHPAWLLGFRFLAFVVLLSLLIATALVDGGSVFLFYTQWTFSLVTLYFAVSLSFIVAIGSLLSAYGCFQYHNKICSKRIDNVEVDSELGAVKSSVPSLEAHKPAGTLAYVFQIIFQINAGAVMLTDCVFWFILVPFLEANDYDLNFLLVSMHTINAVFLLGDAALNCLRFPLFRAAYFFLWTVVFVFFQWILHAHVIIWWPYPFLDLSSPYAPLWYSSVAVMHIPCFGVFALVIKFKHHVLSRKFPESYRCAR